MVVFSFCVSQADRVRQGPLQRLSRRGLSSFDREDRWLEVVERIMRKFLFVLASTAAFAITNPAIAQLDLSGIGQGLPPGPPPPSNWGEERPPPIDLDSAEPQQPSPYSTGSVGVTDPNAVGGECAKGFSEETCRRRGEKYNPPRSD